METVATQATPHTPWNKGKLVGQKAPLKLKEIWAIRVRLQLDHRARELALFDLGIDSKLRGCDLVELKVQDVCNGTRVASRAVSARSSHLEFQLVASNDHVHERDHGHDGYGQEANPA
jgi:hypothetical protein